MSNKELIMAIGNIGMGKSLIARKYALKGYQVVNIESLVTMLNGGEYGCCGSDMVPLYNDIYDMLLNVLFEAERPVFLDRMCINRMTREKYILMAKDYGYRVIALDFGPGDMASVQRRKGGFDEIIEAPKQFRFYAFGFDGTIVQNEFPSIGDKRPKTIERMESLYAELHNIIIIWTCRDNNLLLQMREYLIKEKIPYDFINENPILKTSSPKILAHKYYSAILGEFVPAILDDFVPR